MIDDLITREARRRERRDQWTAIAALAILAMMFFAAWVATP